MNNTRYIVYKALIRMEEDNAYSNIILDEVLSNSDADNRDKAFISAIFYGVLERKITLDYIIRSFSSVRLKKIEREILIILRIAVYQLVFMDKVPDSAAVNEAVKTCKKEKLYRSASFVNALLRSLTKADNRFPLPDKRDTLKYLSVKYSCPENIVSLWINDYSLEITENILSSLFGRPPIFIRTNTVKTNAQELIDVLKQDNVNVSSTFLDNALEISGTGSITSLDAYKKGLFHVQDLSSQICCELACVKNGDIVSDVCAAPGGKTLNLAQRTIDGTVYSYDIYDHKIKLITSSAQRLGLHNITASIRNAAAPQTELNLSDVVLCDVPCSGLGVIRRKPEIRYKEELGVDALPELQLEILETSSEYVKRGGVLIYSTCTLNKKENNINASLFLERSSDFEPLPLVLPSGVERTIDEAENCITMFPSQNGSDGFFTAAFRRK